VSRRANPTLIGFFIFLAIALIFTAVFMLAGGSLFKQRDRAVMYFRGSTYGLQVGAPVVFRGVRMGSVSSIGVTFDRDSDTFSIPVMADIERDVIRVRPGPGKPTSSDERLSVRELVQRGLVAQLTMQSLLTGQLYVDLDFQTGDHATHGDNEPGMIEIPTVDTAIQRLKQQVDSLDFRKLADDVATIASSARNLISGPELGEALANVRRITTNVDKLTAQMQARIGPLADSMQRTLNKADIALGTADAAMKTVDGAASRVDQAAGTVDSALAPDSALMNSLQSAAADIAAASDALKQAASQDGPLMQDAQNAMQDLSRAARSLRELSDTIERRPESLLRGRQTSP